MGNLNLAKILIISLIINQAVYAQEIHTAPGFEVEVFAEIEDPIGLELNANGDLLVANVPGGTISMIHITDGVNTGTSLFAGPGIPIMVQPEYMEVAPDGTVFTVSSDSLGQPVVRISPDGGDIDVFTPATSVLPISARGLALDANGDLYMANNTTSAFITKFIIDDSGNVSGQIDQLGVLPPNSRVVDIDFRSDGVLFAATGLAVTIDGQAGRIQRVLKVTFDQSGEIVTADPEFSTFPVSFNSFFAGIAINNTGSLFVSQVNFASNNEGKIFSIDENGTATVFASGFNQPRDMVFDDQGRMYVSDWRRDKIYRISPQDQDSDMDGVPDLADLCPETTIPESVPTVRLGVHRFALTDGDTVFDTRLPQGNGPPITFTIEDTSGCSCEQILDIIGGNRRHRKFGCTLCLMSTWIVYTAEE